MTNPDAPTHPGHGGRVMTVTPETTVGELQAWLDRHHAVVILGFNRSVDRNLQAFLGETLAEGITKAIEKFADDFDPEPLLYLRPDQGELT